MTTTPEGKVKKQIRALLEEFNANGELYQYWPVPSGMGPSSLDCLVCYYGAFIGIEAKAPGEVPTPRQEFTIDRIDKAHGATFVIDGPEGLAKLRAELTAIRQAFGKVILQTGDGVCRPL